MKITADNIRSLIDYDHNTGLVSWREREVSLFPNTGNGALANASTWNKKNAGKVINTSYDNFIRRNITIFGRKRMITHLIWLWCFGFYPNGVIDHIDGDQSNNKIDNLRDVSHKTNLKNQKLSSANKSGHLGVSFDEEISKWRARIKVDQKDINLGYYKTFEEACAARQAAEKKYGFHENHGKR